MCKNIEKAIYLFAVKCCNGNPTLLQTDIHPEFSKCVTPGTFSDLYTKLHGPAATKRLCSNMFSSLAMDSSFSTLVHNYISSLSFKEVSIPTTKRISPLHVRVNNKLCFSMDFFSFTSGRNGSS